MIHYNINFDIDYISKCTTILRWYEEAVELNPQLSYTEDR